MFVLNNFRYEVFLRTPGLLPLAVLSSTIDPEIILNEVAG